MSGIETNRLITATTLPELWEHVFKASVPEEVFLLSTRRGKQRNFTYKEVNANIHCLAAYLVLKGIRKGDRVMILAENQPVYPFLDLAVQQVGAINVTLDHQFTAKEVAEVVKQVVPSFIFLADYAQYHRLKQLLDTANCELICNTEVNDLIREGDKTTTLWNAIDRGKVFWREHALELKELKDAVTPERPATILFQKPLIPEAKLRGVVLTHQNILAAIVATQKTLLAKDYPAAVISIVSLASAAGRLAGYYFPLAMGSTLRFVPNLHAAKTTIRQNKPDWVIAPAAFLHLLAEKITRGNGRGVARRTKAFRLFERAYGYSSRDQKIPLLLSAELAITGRPVFNKVRNGYFPSVKYFVTDGINLSEAAGYFYEALGIAVLTCLGADEASGILAVNPPHNRKFGSLGKVVEGINVELHEDWLKISGAGVSISQWEGDIKSTDKWVTLPFSLSLKDGSLFKK